MSKPVNKGAVIAAEDAFLDYQFILMDVIQKNFGGDYGAVAKCLGMSVRALRDKIRPDANPRLKDVAVLLFKLGYKIKYEVQS